MPVLDVSHSSFRALVKAAHERGMSVDRFIQHRFARQSDTPDVNDAINAGEIAAAGRPATPARAYPNRPVSKVDAERTGTSVGPTKTSSSFDEVWRRIEQSAGKEISTKRGQSFTYEVEAGYLTVRESGTRVPRSQFRKALGQWPATGPSTMRGVYAASVVWAVLADCLAPVVRGALGLHQEAPRGRPGP